MYFFTTALVDAMIGGGFVEVHVLVGWVGVWLGEGWRWRMQRLILRSPLLSDIYRHL